jgi:hypothetical protein
MDGPRRRALRYFAPVLILLGLYDVWNIEHRRRVNAARRAGAIVAMAERAGYSHVDTIPIAVDYNRPGFEE